MNNTNTNGEQKPIFITTPKTSYGKILVMMMRFPEAKLLANQFDDLRATTINVNTTLFNIYIGRKVCSRMLELKHKGLINSEPCPDAPKYRIYSLRAGLQVILTDKTVEVYEIAGYKAPKSDSWVEKMTRRFWDSLWK